MTLNSVKRGTVRTTGHSLDKMARVERKLIDKITKYPQRLAVWQNKVAKVTKKIVEALVWTNAIIAVNPVNLYVIFRLPT